jgi:hypothetical protein
LNPAALDGSRGSSRMAQVQGRTSCAKCSFRRLPC